ncbi:MAG: hypothetical protein CMB99_02480 [Flavobacteriaceae bacterium]|nr:hypothetical protein [Flavobacteriaceae bacterium]|tara:strand:+ start:61954 stop:62430 length:477 start_codon:yes stop_codon:yes gene_type:complete
MKKILLTLTLLIGSITLSFAQKIEYQKVFGGYKYTQDGSYLTMKQISKAVEANTQAFDLMKKAQSNNSIANVMGFIGGGLIGWPIGTAVGGGDANWALAGIGAGLVAVAIPISNSAHKKARKAIDMYNSSNGMASTKNFTPEFKIVGNTNGFGISMSF